MPAGVDLAKESQFCGETHNFSQRHERGGLRPDVHKHNDGGQGGFSQRGVFPDINLRYNKISFPVNLLQIWVLFLASLGILPFSPNLVYFATIEPFLNIFCHILGISENTC